MRHGRRVERSGHDRYRGPFDHSACIVAIREPEVRHISGETEQRGPDHRARSYEVREGKTSHRQALHLDRTPSGYSISGTKTRSREGNNKLRKQPQILRDGESSSCCFSISEIMDDL